MEAALEKTMDAVGVEIGGAFGLEEQSGTLTLMAHRGLSAGFVRACPAAAGDRARREASSTSEQPVSGRWTSTPRGS